MLFNSERVRVLRRDTYTDPAKLAPGERPIARADGSLVEYVELVTERAAEGVAPTVVRATVEAGINGEAAEGLVGTATMRAVNKQEAKLDGRGRPYIAETTKWYLAGFKAA